jgi:hypothetical protein
LLTTAPSCSRSSSFWIASPDKVAPRQVAIFDVLWPFWCVFSRHHRGSQWMDGFFTLIRVITCCVLSSIKGLSTVEPRSFCASAAKMCTPCS